MCKNYERRVKDFIIEMSNPETRIEINDITEKILNPKVDLSETKEIQKPFIFKGYSTELDRIKDTVNNNRYLYNLPDYDDVIKKAHSVKKSPKLTKKRDLSVSQDRKNDYIIQPQMRFKPRTDLERVYDTLNGYQYSENEKQVIERQLRKINLYDYKKSPLESYKNNAISRSNKNDNNNDSYTKNKLIEEKDKNYKNSRPLNTKLYYTPMRTSENSKPWERKTDLNDEAYNILKSYHQKLHFKAAKEIACNTIKNQKKTKSINNKTSLFLLPNLNHRNYFLKTNTYRDPDLSDLENEINDIKFNDDKETKNEVEYKNNINPLTVKEKIPPPKETMKYLKKMAFQNIPIITKDKDSESDLIKMNVNSAADDDNVVIGKQVFNKKKQFGAITNKVLDTCNVWTKKSMFNDTFLKKGNGKTMITQGMTLVDFENKYNLKE